MQVPVHASLASNLSAVRERIDAAARRAGRDGARVRLVAVTKSVDAEVAAELVRAGQLDLGESRADELERKAGRLAEMGLFPRWHFVGHLQRNKARRVAERAALVHSVDGLPLLETLERVAGEVGRTLDVLVQVKLHAEESKSGLEPRELAACLRRARDLRHVRAVGLMAIAPLLGDAQQKRDLARDVFRRCADLAREHRELFAREPELSLGMSDDFEIAVEEGATLVRVGSLLFAGREEAA